MTWFVLWHLWKLPFTITVFGTKADLDLKHAAFGWHPIFLSLFFTSFSGSQKPADQTVYLDFKWVQDIYQLDPATIVPGHLSEMQHGIQTRTNFQTFRPDPNGIRGEFTDSPQQIQLASQELPTIEAAHLEP